MFVGRAEGSCGLMHAHPSVWGDAQPQGMCCLADSSAVCVTGLANGLSGNTTGAFNMVRLQPLRQSGHPRQHVQQELFGECCTSVYTKRLMLVYFYFVLPL